MGDKVKTSDVLAELGAGPLTSGPVHLDLAMVQECRVNDGMVEHVERGNIKAAIELGEWLVRCRPAKAVKYQRQVDQLKAYLTPQVKP